MEKAVATCAGAIVIGALVGAAIGNNTGDGNARRGATRGAVVGGAVCVVLLAMASEKDKEQLAAAQRSAVSSNRAQRVSYRGDDGKSRIIAISAPSLATDPEAPTRASPRLCRMTSGNVNVAGVGESSLPSQMWCRNDSGDWEPIRS